MSDNINLSGVEDTLFIPLAARIDASRKFPEFFYDEKALELSQNEAVAKVLGKSSEYSTMASVSRNYNVDKFAKEYIAARGKSAIICLGCGLETMNYRLKDVDAIFYTIDFPDVIVSREKVYGKAGNEVMIGSDIMDLNWISQVDTSLPILMIVSGVFQYFKPNDVFKLFSALKKALPGAEMIFDATDEVGIKYAQKYVKKTGNTSAMMYFYINDANEFAEKAGVELIKVSHFYDDARRMLKKKLGLYSRIAMKIADEKGRTKILHIRF